MSTVPSASPAGSRTTRTTRTPARPVLAISGWGVVSAAGIGAEQFHAALASGTLPATVDAAAVFGDVPQPRCHALVAFDAKEFLGAKGLRFLDRSTCLALVACGQALQDTDLPLDRESADRVGVILGTTSGSVKAAADYSRDTLVHEVPYQVRALAFPTTSMNCAAGQSAIRYRLRGVNATIAGGPLAVLSALRFARVALARGGADALIVGAVDEYSQYVAWLARGGLRDPADRVPLGEGAAVFVVEAVDPLAPVEPVEPLDPLDSVEPAGPAGRGPSRRAPDAEVLAVEVGQYGPPGEPPDLADGLADCVRRALAAAGVEPGEVRLVVASEGDDEALAAIEQSALAATVPGAERLAVKPYTGEAGAASGALQIAAVLARHRHDPGRDGWISLVTACSPEGSAGAAVLRGRARVGPAPTSSEL